MRDGRLKPVLLDHYKPLREMVYESLRDAILQGVLKPGDRLMEVELAEELGVSRTPVREAIHKLVLEGYALISPRRGVQVSRISIEDVSEAFEIRGALESLAAGLAAERSTQQEIEEMDRCLALEKRAVSEKNTEEAVKQDSRLHHLIYQASRNERLQNILLGLQEQLYRVRLTTMSLLLRPNKSLEGHRKIVESIGERNAELARKYTLEHIDFARQVLIEHLKFQKEEDR